LYSALGMIVKEQNMNYIISTLDLNKNGTIELNEFITAVSPFLVTNGHLIELIENAYNFFTDRNPYEKNSYYYRHHPRRYLLAAGDGAAGLTAAKARLRLPPSPPSATGAAGDGASVRARSAVRGGGAFP
jgi:hypothetical protein